MKNDLLGKCSENIQTCDLNSYGSEEQMKVTPVISIMGSLTFDRQQSKKEVIFTLPGG